jgi:hypothetical protein
VAQIPTIFADDFPDSARTRVGLVGEYGINSNAITNKFITKFYNGGYIDIDKKDDVLGRVKNVNRIGGDVNYGIYVAFKPDSILHKKNVSVFLSFRNREHFDARFSNDLYKVVFYGNAQFAGKTANLNDFNFNLIRYQQLQVGIYSTKYDSAARWGIGLSFLKGESYTSILAKKAELFTSDDGQYIDFNTSLQAMQTDTTHKGIGAFNGYGASADVYFEAPFKTRVGNSKIRISVSDLGVIRFNTQSYKLTQDSLFHYSGITINNINNIQDSTFNQLSKDSIINSLLPLKKQAFSVTLPSVLNLCFETKFNDRFHLTEGIRYMFNANYKLLSYVKGDFYINSRLMMSATFSYGGYGHFNYGLGVFANFGNGFMLYAGSNNIEGFIVPSKTTGQGAYLSLVKNFK